MVRENIFKLENIFFGRTKFSSRKKSRFFLKIFFREICGNLVLEKWSRPFFATSKDFSTNCLEIILNLLWFWFKIYVNGALRNSSDRILRTLNKAGFTMRKITASGDDVHYMLSIIFLEFYPPPLVRNIWRTRGTQDIRTI